MKKRILKPAIAIAVIIMAFVYIYIPRYTPEPVFATSQVTPDSDSPLNGTWKGRWKGLLANYWTMHIQQISENKAQILYSWSDNPLGTIDRGKNCVYADIKYPRIVMPESPGVKELSFTYDVDTDTLHGKNTTPYGKVFTMKLKRSESDHSDLTGNGA